MGKRRSIKPVLYIFIAALIVIFISPFVTSRSSNLLALADRSEFCIRCHVMQSEYEAWIHSGAHRRKNCVDCHLPNYSRPVHYLWKSIDGLRDMVVFYSGRVPEKIKMTSHGEKVLQANCIRCHETTVMMIDTTRKCWQCHKRITHGHAGAMEIF